MYSVTARWQELLLHTTVAPVQRVQDSLDLQAEQSWTCHSMSATVALAGASSSNCVESLTLSHTPYVTCPAYLTNIVVPAGAGRTRSRSRFDIVHRLHAPRLRTKFAERAFLYAGPSAWNGLPEVLRAVADPDEFRKQLKTHFFTASHNVYWYFSWWILCFYDCCNAPMFIFSKRGLMFTFAICRHPSVCLSSVTFVHPTQAIEIFGSVSTPFGTLAICDPSVKILRRSSQGNPSVGGSNQRAVDKCSDFGPFQGYISETMQDRR